MLTSLRIRNFKAWQDTGKVRLAPLTLIFGANSVGKSSLGQWLQVLKQSVQSDGSTGALDFGNPGSLIQLGTFKDCIHDHDRRRELGFNLQWSLPTPLTLGTDPAGKLLQGNTLALEVALSGTTDARAQLRSQYYRLLADQRQVLATTGARLPRAGWQLHCEQLLSLPAPVQRPQLQAPTLFHQMPTGLGSLYANSELLDALPLQTAALLEATHHLGPLRELPLRHYHWQDQPVANVGHKGELALAALLAATAAERRLSRGPGQRAQPFATFIAQWLRELGVIERFTLRRSRQGHELLLKTPYARKPVALDAVGFGIAQLLPVLVQPFHCPPHATVWLEQPELHLHPRLQADLADVLIGALKARENGQPRQVQLVVETHSEYLLARLQRRIAEQVLHPDEVALHYCRKGSSGAEIEELRINGYGEIENWPPELFGNELADLAARTVAALRRRKAEVPRGYE
jgi:predicted ATPase